MGDLNTNFIIGLVVVLALIYLLYHYFYQTFSIYTSGSLQRYASILSATDQRPGSISSGAFNSPINNKSNGEKELFSKLHGESIMLNM